jgi:hypothetical protein
MHISVQSLEEQFPGEGKRRYNAIAKIVGAELAGGSFSNHDGGIDLTGALDAANEAYSKDQQKQIRAFAEDAAVFEEKPAKPAKAEKAEDKKEGDK